MTEDMERIWRIWDQTRENGPASPASGFFRGSVAGGASEDRKAQPGCTGRKRHKTAGDAVAFASRMVKRTGGVRPYECPHCKGWHLTSRTFRIARQ